MGTPEIPLPRLTGWPDGSPSPGRHLLALPDGVVSSELEVLAISRFTAARWERPPRVSSRGRGGGRATSDASPGILRLGRLSTLTGPFGTEPPVVARLGLPPDTVAAWPVDVPRERGTTVLIGGDREGLHRAFGTEQAIREEERVLRWLVAVARRLGGSVLTDSGVLLVPDMDGALDLTVLSDVWLEPEAVLAAVQRVIPEAAVDAPPAQADPLASVTRASRALIARPVPGSGVADESERRRLHAEADAFDAWMMENPPPAEGFGILGELGEDGLVVVRAEKEHDLPVVLRGLDWTQGDVIAYRVSWEAPDLAELGLEHPSASHRAARTRAAEVLRSVTREVQSVVGGEVADEYGFLVNPAEL